MSQPRCFRQLSEKTTNFKSDAQVSKGKTQSPGLQRVDRKLKGRVKSGFSHSAKKPLLEANARGQDKAGPYEEDSMSTRTC